MNWLPPKGTAPVRATSLKRVRSALLKVPVDVVPEPFVQTLNMSTPEEVRSSSKLSVKLDFGKVEGPMFVTVAAVDEGMLISFSGILTFPRSTGLHEAAKALPLEHLLVETDPVLLVDRLHEALLA